MSANVVGALGASSNTYYAVGLGEQQEKEPVINANVALVEQRMQAVSGAEVVAIMTPAEIQMRLFQEFCDKISFSTAYKSLVNKEYTDQEPDDLRSFLKDIEEVSIFLRKNPDATVPTIYKVVCEGKDEAQVIRKIHVYRMLLEVAISLSEKGLIQCEVDPRVRDAFVFVVGQHGGAEKEKIEGFDGIYEAAKRVLDPEGTLLAKISQEKYMSLEGMWDKVAQILRASIAEGVPPEERRLFVNSIAPEINFREFFTRYPDLAEDAYATGYGSFNRNEPIDRELKALKKSLKKEEKSEAEIGQAISEARAPKMQSASAFHGSFASNFSFEAFLMAADFNRGGALTHPDLYCHYQSPIQRFIAEADQAWCAPNLIGWRKDVTDFETDGGQNFGRALLSHYDEVVGKWNVGEKNQKKLMETFLRDYLTANEIGISEDKGDFCFTRLLKKMNMIHDVTINNRQQGTFSDWSLSCIRSKALQIVSPQQLYKANMNMYERGGRMNTALVEHPNGHVWGMRALEDKTPGINVRALRAEMKRSIEIWGPRPEAVKEDDGKQDN